ncbi:hypothetical protein [Streptomyces sp. CBMA29]|uniref:hypothetical protein n=1 Tax=Streptomyces sp. CBMA29 TaxID=1896314 RepID=UPI001661E848|nr:hypothetical protein [Streptomyces sp. CBMA29]
MDPGIVTVLSMAVVEVLGTLLSALLPQWAEGRRRQREQERTEAEPERRRGTPTVSAWYVALNIAVEQNPVALTEQVDAQCAGSAEFVRQQLPEAQHQYLTVCTEVRLRGQHGLLVLVGDLSQEADAIYDLVRRVDHEV